MTFQKLVMLLLFLTTGLQSAAAEQPAALIGQLADSDLAKRLEAVRKLAAMGEAARPALERVLQPLGPQGPGRVVASKTQATRIAALVAQLSSPAYKTRVQATRALIRIGPIAAPALREVAKGNNLEAADRAKQVLATFSGSAIPKEAVRSKREAAMLLALIGSRASIPALRHTLRTGGGGLAAQAASALRAILHGGPSDDSELWESQRAKLLAAWDAHLDRPAFAPSGAPTTLKLRYRQGVALQAQLRNKLSMRIDITEVMLRMGQAVPQGAPPKMVMQQRGKSVYGVTVNRSDPLALTMRFAEHQSVLKQTAMAQAPRPDRQVSWSGKALRVEVAASGVPLLKLDEKPFPKNSLGPMLHMGLLPATQLPQGVYRPGESRRLGTPFFVLVHALLFASSRPGSTLIGHRGKLTYLGRRDGEDRFFLVAQFDTRQGGRSSSVMRLALLGELRVLPLRGVLAGYELSGPLDGEFAPPGGGGGRMLAQGHWGMSHALTGSAGAVQKSPANKKQKDGN